MQYVILVFVLVICNICSAASTPEPLWPSWVGVSKGASSTAKDIGYDQDDHTNYDCGSDNWGWWANLEIVSGGSVVATIEMRYIDIQVADYGKGPVAGLFQMGAPFNEQGARPEEMPAWIVPVSQVNGGSAFWMSADEISQDVWEQVMGVSLVKKLDDDSNINNRDTVAAIGLKTLRAVESQTLAHVKQFCTDLQSMSGVASTVRLPTEQEWEYACRAGTATAFWTGRILNGIISSSFSGATVTPSGMMYDYDEADMVAKASSAPNGDGGLTPVWDYSVHSVNGDGLATNPGNWPVTIRIGGKLTITGGDLELEIAALFDDRYQHRYKADHFGAYTPILMLYQFDAGGSRYLPRPYADPSSPDMYYRFLELVNPDNMHDPVNYVKVSDLNLSNARQRHYIPLSLYARTVSSLSSATTRENLDFYATHIGTEPGDWYLDSYDTNYLKNYASANGLSNSTPLEDIPPQGKQLEYREMIFVNVRFNSSGVEDPNGNYIKDFDGTLHPIRSMYTPIPFWDDGIRPYETLPTTDIDIAKIARQVDQNDPADPGMNTDEYVESVISAMSDYWNGKNIPNTFYSGPFTGIVEFRALSAEQIRKGTVDDIQVEMGAPATDVTFGSQGRSPWGLFNMHGNVEEWVDTRWDGRSDYSDPALFDTGPFYISKGGSWKTGADRCRSAARTARDPNQAYDDLGFRIIIE